MTALAVSFSPTVRTDVNKTWTTSPALSFRAFRERATPKLSVNIDDVAGPYERRVLKAMVAQLEQLLALDEGWDGGRAKRVSQVSAILALHLAGNLVSDLLLLPQVFPLPDGGVQLEWLIDGNGLEIEVSPNGEVSALGVDAEGSTEIDSGFGAGTDGRAMVATKSYLRTIAKPLLG